MSTFTIEQEQKYVHRFEERFDPPDEQYEAWLRVKHPEQLRAGAIQHGANTPTMKSLYLEVSPTHSTAKSTTTPQRSPLIDLLNVPVPKISQPRTMKTGKAQVLTSAECLKALQEKENEKMKKS